MTVDWRKLFIDGIIISFCWFGAYFIRTLLEPLFGYEINPFVSYIIAYPFILFAWVITALYSGVYRKYGNKGISSVITGFKAWIISVLISMSFAYLFRELHLARSVILMFSLICFIALTIKHYASVEEVERKALIIGTGSLAIRIMQKVEDLLRINILGIVSIKKDDIGKKIDKYEVIGKLSDIKNIIKEKNIDTIIFAEENIPFPAVMDMISSLSELGLSVMVASDEFKAIKYGFDVEFVGGIPLVEFSNISTSPLYELIKRIMDITLSSILLVLLFPVFLIIALAIKIDSEGPVFFIQNRVGKDGKIFKVIKFRTMFHKTPKYSLSPRSPEDPRITRVGRFLRRWSLDELPQIINVLKGEMSLVGPRPEMPQIVQEYLPWQKERLKVKPGITGLWQIIGRKNLPLEQNLQYDILYIKTRSLLLDIIIILKTVPAVLKGKGAY
ncbi:MAG: sugar transferase [bacterium]|nr:sugar transferase [bacterium]